MSPLRQREGVDGRRQHEGVDGHVYVTFDVLHEAAILNMATARYFLTKPNLKVHHFAILMPAP